MNLPALNAEMHLQHTATPDANTAATNATLSTGSKQTPQRSNKITVQGEK